MNHHAHDRLHAQADAIGAQAARVVDAAWAELWRGMRPGVWAYAANQRHARRVLDALPGQMYGALRGNLGGLLGWAYERAAEDLQRRLPLRLREDETGGGELDTFRALLLPALPEDRVASFLDRILPARDWLSLGEQHHGQTPHSLASLIASRYAAGDSTQDVARHVLPFFDGSRTRAMRAARTFGAYVGTSANLEASEQLGDLVVGYEVHDPGGPTARPDHMKRSGTRYYRNPRPGQWSMAVMPQPPFDRGGPFEDERGLRWNCRCWLSPIIAGLE